SVTADREMNLAVSGCLDPARPGSESHIDSIFPQDLFDLLGHVAVLTSQEARPAHEDRDPAAIASKHLAELDGDVASAQDQEMPGQSVQLHDRSRIQERHAVESVDLGDDRPGARVDEDPVALQAQVIAGAFDPDISRIDELRAPAAYIQMRDVFQGLLGALSKALVDLLFALPDPGEIDRDAAGLHAVIACPPGKVGHARAGDHGLGRRSAVVDAGSSDILFFDDGRLEPRSPQDHREGLSSLAGAEDDRVIGSFRWHFSSRARGDSTDCEIRRSTYSASTL